MFNGSYLGSRAAAPLAKRGPRAKSKPLLSPARGKTPTPRTSKTARTPLVQPKPAAATTTKTIPAAADSAVDTGSQRELASALAAFLRNAVEVPLLTVEEEKVLARKIKRGDSAAREQMIRANLRLVVKIARDYENLGLPLLDLISEGSIGLMKAVERFDPAKGGKLSTYGSWWIKQQIRRAIANQARTIRLPVHVEASLYRMGKTEIRLREVLGRDASTEELADELGINARRVARLKDASSRPASLDAPIGEGADASMEEIIRDEQAHDPAKSYEAKADQTLMLRLLKKLPTREEMILRARFGLDGNPEQTLETLGVRFRLTRERIRQLQNEAFAKLRKMMERPDEIPFAA